MGTDQELELPSIPILSADRAFDDLGAMLLPAA